ncbi:MAG: hypothetical protein JWP14_320 [Frankiales bacterium]|nr:hypothetical protein [Frankiales bacterium]
MRLVVNAAPLGWPRCGTRTYLSSLLLGLHDIGASDRVDLLLPQGHLASRLVPLARVLTPQPSRSSLRYAWLWEQATVPRSGAVRRNVLLTPYVAPPAVALVPRQAFALLDVLPWLPSGAAGRSRVGAAVHDVMARNARRAPLALAISEFTRQEGIAHLGLDPSRVTTVPLAAAASFRPQDDDQVAAVLADVGVDRPYVLYVGGFGGRKRPEALVEAFACSAELRAGFALVLVGTPPPAFLSRALEAGVRVTTTGDVSDSQLAALYSGAALTSYLSDYEGFGLPPVEATACGSRVLSSPLPPVQEALGDQVRYVTDLEPVSLAEQLLSASAAPPPVPQRQRTWTEVARDTWTSQVEVWPQLAI